VTWTPFVMSTLIRLFFSGGERRVPAAVDAEYLRGLRLQKDGIQWVSGPELKAWADRASGVPAGAIPDTPDVLEPLADIAKHYVLSICDDPDALRHLSWQLGNVIERDPVAGANGYAGTVHRDLDEVAVSNFRSDGVKFFFNVWVPVTTVASHPLAVVLPATVDFAADAAGFRGLEHDRTGLVHRDSQQWVAFPQLGPGDCLVWVSNTVYHASYASEACDASTSRRSVDLRFLVSASTGKLAEG
jgi:hypothetical protein